MRSRSDRIVKRWHGLSIKAMPHLDALTGAEFESSIAAILSALADALQSSNPRCLSAVMEQGPLHGIDRFLQKGHLLDLFEKVRILRGVILLELAEEMLRPLHVTEAATFHAIFDIIIQQAVMALVQQQNEIVQQARDISERCLVTAVE